MQQERLAPDNGGMPGARVRRAHVNIPAPGATGLPVEYGSAREPLPELQFQILLNKRDAFFPAQRMAVEAQVVMIRAIPLLPGKMPVI